MTKILPIVHCIDTEGPLYESLKATFERVNKAFSLNFEPSRSLLIKLQQGAVDCHGHETSIMEMLDPKHLDNCEDWGTLESMLDQATSDNYRREDVDSFGKGWIYNWFVVDHVNYTYNPRRRAIGYHAVFDHYFNLVKKNSDGLFFHHHPKPFDQCAHHSATQYFAHDDSLFQSLCRRLIDYEWFPNSNRPGFHVTRADSHWFMEQYIPFDYSNQSIEVEPHLDFTNGRFGDWRRAPNNWAPYHPNHDDYQSIGNCRRWIMRCLNLGSRSSAMSYNDVEQAFEECESGKPTILSFCNHDYRDLQVDVNTIRAWVKTAAQKYPRVDYSYSKADDAAREVMGIEDKSAESLFHVEWSGNCLNISSSRPTFGPQPFFAFKSGHEYRFDNLDTHTPFRSWSYVFDHHTIALEKLDAIGIASSDQNGFVDTEIIRFK